MHGLMMSTPLLISSLIQHADRCHGETEIVLRQPAQRRRELL